MTEKSPRVFLEIRDLKGGRRKPWRIRWEKQICVLLRCDVILTAGSPSGPMLICKAQEDLLRKSGWSKVT